MSVAQVETAAVRTSVSGPIEQEHRGEAESLEEHVDALCMGTGTLAPAAEEVVRTRAEPLGEGAPE
jgi:hypothetical protein